MLDYSYVGEPCLPAHSIQGIEGGNNVCPQLSYMVQLILVLVGWVLYVVFDRCVP